MYAMPEEKSENFFTELLKFIVLAVIIVVPVRLWVAQPFIVSGASMEPTFHTGQYLIIDELSYHIGDPHRGDVIIFRYPLDTSEFFIKRVIGLPGETVQISNNTVTIVQPDGTNEKLNEPYLTNIGDGPPMSRTLGAGEYFVMGDNRPDSSDSRVWGVVPRSDLVGHVLLRLLPLSSFGPFPGSFTFPSPGIAQ